MAPDQTNEPEPAPAANVAEKRTYEKPAIIWHKNIDTRAISIGCGKSIPVDPPCISSPQS